MAYEDFHKDVCCWNNYKTDYNKYMENIMDDLISIQDNLRDKNNLNDTALANLVHDFNITNIIANSDPDCMTEDDLNFCRDYYVPWPLEKLCCVDLLTKCISGSLPGPFHLLSFRSVLFLAGLGCTTILTCKIKFSQCVFLCSMLQKQQSWFDLHLTFTLTSGFHYSRDTSSVNLPYIVLDLRATNQALWQSNCNQCSQGESGQ